MTFDFFFEQLSQGNTMINEFCFYFKSDANETKHFIGYIPDRRNNNNSTQNAKPYWAGLCDIPDGCEFATAKELTDAKIYCGKSLRELWDEIVICSIAALSVEDWMTVYNKCSISYDT